MKDILTKLFKLSIAYGEESYSLEQAESGWLGNTPASEKEIRELEDRLRLKLPADYKEMLKVANGFPTCSDSTEPSFLLVSEVDYYRNHPNNGISQLYEMGESTEMLDLLDRAILIAGAHEEQKFLLIPPLNDEAWRYWKYANWIPGEEEYQDLLHYFNSVIEFLEKQIGKS